jgi:hypothetical protein
MDCLKTEPKLRPSLLSDGSFSSHYKRQHLHLAEEHTCRVAETWATPKEYNHSVDLFPGISII